MNKCPLGLKAPYACWNCQHNYTKTKFISMNICISKCSHPNYKETYIKYKDLQRRFKL